MAKSFSETERKAIRTRLLDACEASWSRFGFKKTGVDALCRQAGISKGAFYLFYQSKDALFCDTLERVCGRINQLLADHLSYPPSRRGLCRALETAYQEYDRLRLLFDDGLGDLGVFLEKLPDERRSRLLSEGVFRPYLPAMTPYLQWTDNPRQAIDVIVALFQTAHRREPCGYDRFAVFAFLIELVVDELFADLPLEPCPVPVGGVDFPERTEVQ